MRLKAIAALVFLVVVCLGVGFFRGPTRAGKKEAALPRVVVIGVDALGWDYLSETAKENGLPFLQSFIRKGVSARLTSFPGGQHVQWDALATGFRPSLVGGSPWWEVSPVLQSLKTKRAFKKVFAPSVGEVLASNGVLVGLTGWPLAFQKPSSKVRSNTESVRFFAVGRRGLKTGEAAKLVSGRSAAPNWAPSAFTTDGVGLFHPPELLQRYQEDILAADGMSDEAIIRQIPILEKVRKKNRTAYLDLKYALTTTVASANVAKRMIEEPDRKFVWSVIWGLDVVQHRANSLKMPQLRIQALEFVDRLLASTLSGVSSKETVLIVSNHAVERKRSHTQRSTDSVLLAKGGKVATGVFVVGAGIVDFAPTVLRFFGMHSAQPVMEGRVMRSVFAPKFLARSVSKAVHSEASVALPKEQKIQAIQALRRENRSKLKRLGYISLGKG